MTSNRWFLAGSILLLATATGAASRQAPAAAKPATAKAPAAKPAAQGADAEIRAWLDTFTKAFEGGDLNKVMALYAPGVVAYDLVPPLQYRGKDAYRKDIADVFAQFNGPVHLEFREVQVDSSGDLAVLRCLQRVNGTMKNGQKVDVWSRLTSVFRKTNGKWLDIHDHASVPADLDTGKAVLDLKP